MAKYPPESQKPGLLKQAGKIAASVGESALQLGTGLTAIVPAVGAGLYEAWKTGGRGEPWQKAEEAYGKATYQPKTKEGQKITETFISMTPLKFINDTTAVAASHAPNPEAAAAIRLGGGLFLNILMGKYGYRLARGEPIYGKDLKLAARNVQNIPEEAWAEIERMPKTPTQDELYASKLAEMTKTSGRTAEEITPWTEAERVRQQPGEYYFGNIEKIFGAIPDKAAFVKTMRRKMPQVIQGILNEIEKIPDQVQVKVPVEQVAKIKETIAPKKNIYRFIPEDAPDIWRKVMDVTNGQGIRPYRTGGKAVKSEEYLSIPRPLRNAKSTYTMDIVADSLGLKTEAALTEALQWNRARVRKLVRTGELPPNLEETPPEIMKIRKDLLAATKMPSDKIMEFEMNTFMDGEKVLEISNEVKAGKKTKAAAVSEITQLIKDTTEGPATTKTAVSPVMVSSLAEVGEWKGKLAKQLEEYEATKKGATNTPMSTKAAPVREGDTQAKMAVLMEKIATSKPLTEADKEFAQAQGIYEEAPPAIVSPEKVGSNYDRGIVTMPKRPGVGGPEAGGLLYGMKLPKFAENINLEKVITREPTLQDAGAEAYGVKQTILELTELHQQRIRTSREAGGRTWEQEGEVAKAIADKMGIEDIAAKFGVKADKLPGFVYASKEIVVKMAEDFNRLRSEYVANPTDENLIRLKIGIEKSGQMLSDISAGTASIGRSLNVMRRIYKSQEYLKTRNYKAAMDAIGGREITDKMARILATIDYSDPMRVRKLVREFSEATTPQKVIEAWKMFILSSPLTHARNTSSNFIALMSIPAETVGRATVEIPRSILTGTPREATFGQAGAELFGMWKGIPEGVRRMLFAFKNEVTMREASKFELGYTTAIKGKLGKGIRIPGRALIAEDEFFKGIIQSADLHSQAWKRASFDLKVGKISRSGFSNRVAEILADPPKEMVEHSMAEALYRTFQKPLGKGGKAIISLKKAQPALEFIAPFIQTPINIAKFGLERTPLNLPRVIWKIAHGDFKGEQASAELAKVGLGTLTSIATFIMAREGMITGGGPVDPKQRQSLYRTGWQPYSVKIGNKYLSYGGLEPFGTVLGISADFAELTDKMTDSEKKKIAGKIIQSITKNITSKTYLQGISGLSDAISDPTRYGDDWINRFARSIVPNAIGTITDSTDPVLRDARDIISTIKSRVPGLSQTNLPRRDVYGKPIEKTGTWLTRLISPVKVSDVAGTDVDRELVRLEIGISLPDRTIKNRELTKAEYDELLQITGGRVETVLGNLIKSAAYKSAADDKRREDMIDYAVRKARELGRTEFMIKNLRKK